MFFQIDEMQSEKNHFAQRIHTLEEKLTGLADENKANQASLRLVSLTCSIKCIVTLKQVKTLLVIIEPYLLIIIEQFVGDVLKIWSSTS